MEPTSHLSVILDLSPTQWYLSSLPEKNKYPLSLRSFLAHTLAFLNSYLAFKHENTLAVYGALPSKSVLFYSTDSKQFDSSLISGPDDGGDNAGSGGLAPFPGPAPDANTYFPFKVVDTAVMNRIDEELDALSGVEEEAPCQLVGALTKALCHINRLINPGSGPASADVLSSSSPEPHIVILSVSPDLSTSYIPLMNAIFSAQKLKVMIDVCKMYGPDAVFLQQAAHLTGGAYIYPERRDTLLQYLLMTFLPPQSMRQLLAVPTQDKVDFRAACFCHKTIVDIGFVCSVCLSIFCQPVPVCSTCRTKFPIKSLQRLAAARPTPPSSAGTAPASARATPPTSAGGGGAAAGVTGAGLSAMASASMTTVARPGATTTTGVGAGHLEAVSTASQSSGTGTGTGTAISGGSSLSLPSSHDIRVNVNGSEAAMDTSSKNES